MWECEIMTPKEYVQNWKELGPVLERLKTEEMLSPEYEKQFSLCTEGAAEKQ